MTMPPARAAPSSPNPSHLCVRNSLSGQSRIRVDSHGERAEPLQRLRVQAFLPRQERLAFAGQRHDIQSLSRLPPPAVGRHQHRNQPLRLHARQVPALQDARPALRALHHRRLARRDLGHHHLGHRENRPAEPMRGDGSRRKPPGRYGQHAGGRQIGEPVGRHPQGTGLPERSGLDARCARPRQKRDLHLSRSPGDIHARNRFRALPFSIRRQPPSWRHRPFWRRIRP